MSSQSGPLVTVVIPTYGRPRMVEKAVRSVLAQDYDPERYEIVVADSSPTDEVEEVVSSLRESAGERIRYARKQPEGPGPSRNLGYRLGSGQLIAFLDSDCQATPGWIREGVAAFDHGVGLVQGAVLPDPDARRGVFTHYLVVDRESFLYETANMFYRREALEQAGGFRADLTPTADTPMGGEDVDLAWRVKRHGWTSRFASGSLVYHEVVPISVWKWIAIRRLYIFPLLIKRIPELRRFFYRRYFYDRAQCLLVLALCGLAAASLTPWSAILALPYVITRAFEPTASLRGFKRPLRVAAYALRDIAGLAILLAGSIRYRTVLL